MIRIDNLRKSYQALVAVDGISFAIQPGECFGLLGPNGAGKTTTINLLTGLICPDSGTIEINGATDPTRPAVRQQLGVTPQSLAIYEDLTGKENLVFFGKLNRVFGKQLTEKIDWALALTGLTDRQHSRVSTYSGGMKRRLNLACSLLHDPPVLLMDEPTVGVDPQSRNLVFDNIENLKKAGRTVLYTTHYMEEAQRLCDRVAIIDHGKILALDTVPNLIQRYGGKTVVEAEFEQPPDIAKQFPEIWDGKQIRIETDNPLEIVTPLVSSQQGMRQLRIEPPSLEDVFLNLTGRRLRD
ncbi:MAG: ABC transporter ATP-binding protein [bacterium]